MGDCQNYGPFLGPYYNTGPNTGPNLGDPKRDHNFDNLPNAVALSGHMMASGLLQCCCPITTATTTTTTITITITIT